MENTTVTQTKHEIPKCTCCGNIGPWKIEPLLTGKHWLIGIILLICGFVPGVFYFMTLVIIRSSKKNRAKICPNCKAQNFIY